MPIDLSQLVQAATQHLGGGPASAGGTSPGGTPPTFGGGEGDQTMQLIQKILSQGQRPQLAQPVPAPVPQNETVQRQSGKFSGPANLGALIQNVIGGAVSQQKAAKLAHAESQWNAMATMMQDQSPEGQQKLQSWFMANQKDLKNMAKALNQDWLNPEKTDVWKQALGTTLQNQQKKQGAAQGMMQLFKHLIGKATQPQPNLSPEQQKQMAGEIQAKAPIAKTSAVGPEEEKLLLEMMKEKDADKRAQAKEDYDIYKTQLTQKYGEWKEQSHQQFQNNLERMREIAAENRQAERDMTMLKAEGMRLSAEDKRRLEVTPAQLNTQVGSVISDMKGQLAQASQRLNEITTQASKSRWYHPYAESGADDVKQAQASYDNLKSAVNYLSAHRAGIISKKEELEDVVNQAQQIMVGSPDLSDLGGKQ
jgi:hypothetical protein